MVETVDSCQVLEHVVIWSERGGGEDGAEDGVGCVVKWITGNQSTTMDIAYCDENILVDVSYLPLMIIYRIAQTVSC